jgi:hypothetical protein
MPRFVAPSIHGREARLGLHRLAPGMITGIAAPSRGARMGLRDRRGMTIAPARPVVRGLLRREPVLRWASDAGERRSTGPLRPAPWRR